MNFYYWFGYHLSRILAKIFFRFRILHRERMIQSGPVILVSNHQSYLDPPLAGNVSDRAIYFSGTDLQPCDKNLYARLSQRVMDAIGSLKLE